MPRAQVVGAIFDGNQQLGGASALTPGQPRRLGFHRRDHRRLRNVYGDRALRQS